MARTLHAGRRRRSASGRSALGPTRRLPTDARERDRRSNLKSKRCGRLRPGRKSAMTCPSLLTGFGQSSGLSSCNGGPHQSIRTIVMAIFDQLQTYVVLSGLLSFVTVVLIPVWRHKNIFNGAAMAAASGFILMACLASFLIADYRIDAGNRRELMRTGKRTEGTIVGFEHVVERGRGGRSRDCPIVQYVPRDGVVRNIAVLESHCSDRANGSDLPLHVTVTYLETGTAIAKVLDWQPARDPEETTIGLCCAAAGAFFLWLFWMVL